MVEQQPELDLPLPRQSGARRKRALFAGFSRGQLVAIVLLACALVWSMWVTKRLLTPERDHIVAARLSNIVGEYVQAQARSAAPPAQVEAEMKAFMATLDGELQKRSAAGEVVLVGEAVLTKNVPDITDTLRRAVYAGGIKLPAAASPQTLQRLQEQLPPASLVDAIPAVDPAIGQTENFDPPAPFPDGPQGAVSQPNVSRPSASVSTFGGPGDGNGQ
ncbi:MULTISPECIES: type-F conjugative transfer system protein TrbI [Sphingomonadaceae]|jgi:hypothetical protein|uniref:TrbI F-type domain-containing protein n=2 Tax=Sphingomonadaceae TaxID=41297 RepID=A0A7X4GKP5_9SPHN|nr:MULTISPECIES: type-F conjugative transfer system protein TrbI [Sphingomonadaceae]MCC4253844.1 type-F conjugative transfer system protein TrbI [Sphingobium naphthae]MEA3482065.1 type-F conjugative transfer system protein TrbI [Pseudomonadota bacterium]ATP22039.1 hypothetical protein BV87_26725 [Sphingobium yanoikuyae]KEZ13744.1 hypothetical protein CP98_04939 [Sphingobium yanoikuyae]KMW29622.1 hypothetical protein BV87_11945 [Sphingobium yanoikuyae]|tara:strand:+ start:3123 stop:3776 length:654 start_codon:yes stop_codon:yes gene_type:complete